jgi:hypothetical protein
MREVWHIAHSPSRFISLCGLSLNDLVALDSEDTWHYMSTDAHGAVRHSPQREVCAVCSLLQLGATT